MYIGYWTLNNNNNNNNYYYYPKHQYSVTNVLIMVKGCRQNNMYDIFSMVSHVLYFEYRV